MKPLPANDLRGVSDRCADVFRALDGAHVLITGASGFVGSWMLESLEHACVNGATRARLTVHARRNVSWACRRMPYDAFACDIRALTIPDDVTHVIHCASAGSASENVETPGDVCQAIRMGTDRVVQECERVGVQRLLHLSSGSVYACGDRQAESSPRRVATASSAQPFALAKLAAEDAVVASGVPAVIARIFALIGPRLGPQFAVSQFFANALAARPIVVANPGTVRAYLYVADLAVWLWTLLVRGEAGTAYNVGNDQALTIGTVAGMVATRTGVPLDLGDGPATGTLWPDITRAQNTLGLEAWTDTNDAVSRTWNWLRETA